MIFFFCMWVRFKRDWMKGCEFVWKGQTEDNSSSEWHKSSPFSLSLSLPFSSFQPQENSACFGPLSLLAPSFSSSLILSFHGPTISPLSPGENTFFFSPSPPSSLSFFICQTLTRSLPVSLGYSVAVLSISTCVGPPAVDPWMQRSLRDDANAQIQTPARAHRHTHTAYDVNQQKCPQMCPSLPSVERNVIGVHRKPFHIQWGVFSNHSCKHQNIHE